MVTSTLVYVKLSIFLNLVFIQPDGKIALYWQNITKNSSIIGHLKILEFANSRRETFDAKPEHCDNDDIDIAVFQIKLKYEMSHYY